MKWYYTLFFIFVVILFALTVYKNIVPQTYDSNGILFNYPGTWGELSKNPSSENHTSSKNIVAVGDPNSGQNGNIIVLVQRTNQSGTLDEIVAASKADLEKDWQAKILSDNIITVDGQRAHDFIYLTNTSKEERTVIFTKNNIVYSIILGSDTSAFDSQKNKFDLIVNSFKVKS